MTRPHVLAVTAVLGAAAVAGVLALTQTVALGQGATSPSPTALAQRQAAIDAAAARATALDADVPPAGPAPQSVPAVPAPEVQTVFVRTGEPATFDEHEDDHSESHEADEHEDDHSESHEADEHEGWDD